MVVDEGKMTCGLFTVCSQGRGGEKEEVAAEACVILGRGEGEGRNTVKREDGGKKLGKFDPKGQTTRREKRAKETSRRRRRRLLVFCRHDSKEKKLFRRPQEKRACSRKKPVGGGKKRGEWEHLCRHPPLKADVACRGRKMGAGRGLFFA